MNPIRVHLEDVARAARQGLVLAIGVALAVLGGLLLAGLPIAIAAPGAAMVLALGCVSGGFGLAARVALPAPRRRPAPAAASGVPAQPLRLPQTR